MLGETMKFYFESLLNSSQQLKFFTTTLRTSLLKAFENFKQ
jgi:hypothetical protein